MDVGHLVSSLFGPQSPGSIVTDLAYCLLLVTTVYMVSRGRRLYIPAVVALAVVLYARTAEGFIDPSLDGLLNLLGLVVAALVVVFDLVFEANPEA